MGTYRISYAQNREDVILNALLKEAKSGFYVDVGANHPVQDSVTKIFYDRGWRGINLEPAEHLHAQLALARPRDINLKVGASDKESELTFREYSVGNGLSTFSTETQDAYKKDENYRYFAKDYVDHKVPVSTLSKILAIHADNVQIDFMKIDVEGYEYEAVAGNDWNKYRPVILCIEANHVVKDWHPILKRANYKQVFWDGLNEYFVAEEHSALVADFSYADSVFFSTPFISWAELKARQDLERQKALLEYKIMRTERSLTSLQQIKGPSTQNNRRKTGLKSNLTRVDRKVLSLLETSNKADTPTALSLLGLTTLAEATEALKQQITETIPKKQKSKLVIERSYKFGRKTLKKAVARKLRK